MPEIIEITRYAVETWIRTVATGEFHYKSVCGIQGKKLTPKDDSKLRGIIFELCKAGVCESFGRKDGWYRPVEDVPKPVDWQGVDASKDFPIVLPFDLRKHVWIDPDTSIVVAGSKDSGKTGLIMRTVVMNMNNINTVFLSNMEGGITQVKRRFDAMDIEIPVPAPFKMYHIIDNFHDAIKEPDTFYAIDYIDVPESGEFYMIAPALARIQRKLVNSVAMIGLQKRTSSDLAFGGEQTWKKSTLYLAMNKGKLKIVHAKVSANPKVDPTNMQWTFQYDDEGTNFVNIVPCYGE